MCIRDRDELVPPPCNNRKVAIVGSGPAGLTCAGDLAKQMCIRDRLIIGLKDFSFITDIIDIGWMKEEHKSED